VSAATPDSRGLSRAVVWTGIMLGTCLAVLAIWDGAVLRIGGLPSWLGVFLGGLLVWVLIVAASVAVAELVRRRGKTAVRYGARQGSRAGRTGWRAARRHGGRGLNAATRWAGRRWAARAGGSAPDAELTYEVPGEADRMPPPPPVPATPVTEPPRRVCTGCGNPEGGQWGPLVVWRELGRDHLIHRAHFYDESTGFYGRPYEGDPAPGEASPNRTGGNTMPDNRTPVNRINPGRRARQSAARGGTMPAAWNAVIARTADFEPENDGDLLDWMNDEVAGVAAYAEALVDLYEGLTEGTGLDPVAIAALHDVADAQAHASETMAAARRKFADHYDRPREFAAEGGLMPHDGRWVTGEGDA